MEQRKLTPEHDLRINQNIRPEELQKRKDFLAGQGFSDQWIDKLAKERPTLFSVEAVTDKIEGLKERGFQNPTKMIQTLPTVLGYSFENIDRRLNILGKLQKTYDLPFSPAEAMEKSSSLFSTKIDKLFITARILRDAQAKPDKPSQINYVLIQNVEDKTA